MRRIALPVAALLIGLSAASCRPDGPVVRDDYSPLATPVAAGPCTAVIDELRASAAGLFDVTGPDALTDLAEDPADTIAALVDTDACDDEALPLIAADTVAALDPATPSGAALQARVLTRLGDDLLGEHGVPVGGAVALYLDGVGTLERAEVDAEAFEAAADCDAVAEIVTVYRTAGMMADGAPSSGPMERVWATARDRLDCQRDVRSAAAYAGAAAARYGDLYAALRWAHAADPRRFDLGTPSAWGDPLPPAASWPATETATRTGSTVELLERGTAPLVRLGGFNDVSSPSGAYTIRASAVVAADDPGMATVEEDVLTTIDLRVSGDDPNPGRAWSRVDIDRVTVGTTVLDRELHEDVSAALRGRYVEADRFPGAVSFQVLIATDLADRLLTVDRQVPSEVVGVGAVWVADGITYRLESFEDGVATISFAEQVEAISDDLFADWFGFDAAEVHEQDTFDSGVATLRPGRARFETFHYDNVTWFDATASFGGDSERFSAFDEMSFSFGPSGTGSDVTA